jgi:hypothetical protein
VFNDLSGGGKSVETTCYFDKSGPSPNDPPKSHAVVSKEPVKRGSVTPLNTNTVKTVVKRTNFTGVWQRTKTVNFEEFIGAQGEYSIANYVNC